MVLVVVEVAGLLDAGPARLGLLGDPVAGIAFGRTGEDAAHAAAAPGEGGLHRAGAVDGLAIGDLDDETDQSPRRLADDVNWLLANRGGADVELDRTGDTG